MMLISLSRLNVFLVVEHFAELAEDKSSTKVSQWCFLITPPSLKSLSKRRFYFCKQPFGLKSHELDECDKIIVHTCQKL